MQSNQTCNDEDRAFQSRAISLHFASLVVPDDIETVSSSNWEHLRELSSCLLIDFDSLLWNGKIDKEAILDCSNFLNATLGVKRDRNLDAWSILLYYMGTMNYLTQANQGQQEDLLEWMCSHVTRANYEMTHHSGCLHQFVIAIHRVRTVLRTNTLALPPEKCISWHNYRERSHPAGVVTGEWIAVRVDQVCAVIKDALGLVFKPPEIYSAITESAWAQRGRCSFYAVSGGNPWPLKKTIFDENAQTCVDVPILEQELPPNTVSEQRCVWMRKAQFDQIVEDVDSGAVPDVNFRTTMIKSNNPQFPPDRAAGNRYNFWDCFTGQTDFVWFGYRAAAHSTFGSYCGAFNMMNVGVDEDLEILETVQQRNVEQGFGTITDLYSPASILEWFGYEKIDLEVLPPGFAECPFAFRDGDGDDGVMTGTSLWGHKSPSRGNHRGLSTPDRASSVGHDGSPFAGPRRSPSSGRSVLGDRSHGNSMPAGAHAGPKGRTVLVEETPRSSPQVKPRTSLPSHHVRRGPMPFY